MIGAGGIGWGRFFALSGNRTLTREESRMGRFLDRRDYCKLHIISHYVKVLSGADFRVVPIGAVGNDEAGSRLVDEMRLAGLDVRHVTVNAALPTLHCICLLYPDGSGGNLTVEDSACSAVDAAAIRAAEPDFAAAGGRGIALAAPEAPLEARRELLELASRHRFFRAASFVAGEIHQALRSGILAQVDLLALNSGEAAAMCADWSGVAGDKDAAEGALELTAAAAALELRRHNPGAILSMTAGKAGSWVCDGDAMHHRDALPVEVIGAAGAGDAFLAGMLTGLAAGMSPAQAHQLAALTAAGSVTSPHTIHEGIRRDMLARLAHKVGVRLEPAVTEFLEAPP